MDSNKLIELKLFSNDIRRLAMTAIHACGVGHVGGSMSIAEAIAALYNGIMRRIDSSNAKDPLRDKLVLSKGHAGPILYAALARKGFFPEETLLTLNQGGSMLPSHADRIHTPGIDMSTGSLGQGASTACGLALSDKRAGRDARTYLILGDGELNEGQVWEAMLFAADKALDNLVVIVDYNKGQVDGYCADVCDMGDLAAKFSAFGLDTRFVEHGNDIAEVYEALAASSETQTKPVCMILNTEKGRDAAGYDVMTSNHHAHVSDAQFETCLKYFTRIDEEIRKGAR